MMRGRAGFLVLLVPLICCSAPVLVAAIVATGAGAWLAANRLLFGSAAALSVSVIALAVWVQQRGRKR